MATMLSSSCNRLVRPQSRSVAVPFTSCSSLSKSVSTSCISTQAGPSPFCHTSLRSASHIVRAVDNDKQASSWSILPSRANPAYLAIIGGYAGLFLLQNPYIFAALTIATIIPQNSTTTSLNSLVIFFYDSGLFMNFAEAVYCVRLVTWLSILCCLGSFAVFA